MLKASFGACLLFATITVCGCHGQVAPAADSASPTPAIDGTSNNNVAEAYAVVQGSSSFIYAKPAGTASAHRITNRQRGWEIDPVISPGGDVVAYSVSDQPEGKSEVWVSRIDGSNAHRVSAPDQDALMPAFANEHMLLYVISRFNGHYSPIARPRKHDFDIVKVDIDPSGRTAPPVELTHQHFFDLISLAVSPDGNSFLISTSAYPIGYLIEGFEISNPEEIKYIYQPHVPDEPSTGAAFGQSAYTRDGMNIVFTAATEHPGHENFDYNVYQMSAVTGGDLTMLYRHTGMIDGLKVGPAGTIFVAADGKRYILDPQMHILRPM